jgi:hypothetical protein
MRSLSRRRLLAAGALAPGLLLPEGATSSAAAATGGNTGAVLGTPPAGSLWTIHGDGGDATDHWEQAFSGIAAAGGGAVQATGRHLISRELVLPDVSALHIRGVGGAVLRKADPGREFRLFTRETPATPMPTLTCRDLHFVGDWDARQSMGGDGARCLAVRGYHRVALSGLIAEGFRNMTFTADDCDEVLVDGCSIRRSARDAINLTGSRFVRIVNCAIQHCWDDAIAVHVPRDVTDEGQRWATLIANNQILQANGIKVLGGHEITIAYNQIISPNNYGIYLGRDPFWREGNVVHRYVVVEGNIISELLQNDYLPGQGDVGAGIFLYDPGGRPQSVRIAGNVIGKYKPSGRGVHYSDWRLGAHPGERRLFTADGWIDPELIHGHQGRGFGIRILCANALDERTIAIEANTIANLGQAIDRRPES